MNAHKGGFHFANGFFPNQQTTNYQQVAKDSMWMHLKVALVFVLIGYHHVCKRILRQFERGENTRSHVWYRWFNEMPVLGMFAVVILVVVKPFA